MKLFYTFILLLLYNASSAQYIYNDVKRDWYAEIPTVDIETLDSIILYPNKSAIDPKKDMLMWQFKYDEIYQLIVFDNGQSGTPGSTYYAPERWTIKTHKNDELELQMKDTKGEKWFHSTLRSYRLIPIRDNYNILQRLVLIRE